MVKHQPATALPWFNTGWIVNKDETLPTGQRLIATSSFPGAEGHLIATHRSKIVVAELKRKGDAAFRDAEFIITAANAYPQLVEALRELMGYTGGWDSPTDHPCGQARDLLRSLGEL